MLTRVTEKKEDNIFVKIKGGVWRGNDHNNLSFSADIKIDKKKDFKSLDYSHQTFTLYYFSLEIRKKHASQSTLAC